MKHKAEPMMLKAINFINLFLTPFALALNIENLERGFDWVSVIIIILIVPGMIQAYYKLFKGLKIKIWYDSN